MSPLRRRFEKLPRRIALGLFLSGSALLLAHIVNALMAQSVDLSIQSPQSVDTREGVEVQSVDTRGSGRRLAEDILTSGLFPLPPNAAAILSGQVPTASGPLAAPPLNVSSKVSLLGVVTSLNGNERAVLEDAGNKTQTIYRVGQSIQDVGELVAIEPSRVLFRSGTQEEWLNLAIIQAGAPAGPHPQVVPAVSPVASAPVKPARTSLAPRTALPRRAVDRALLEELVSDPDMFMTEARLQPHVTALGQIVGFRVDGLRRTGVLAKTGLQNEDILSRINGVELRDSELLWNMLKQMQNEQTVRLDVLRSSTPVTLVVDIRS